MMLATLLLTAATATAPASDPRAVAVADQVMEAMGGEAAWRGTCFLRFDFAVAVDGKMVMTRSHWWDKWRGRYRLEGKTKEGEAYTVLMNLNTKEGSAWQGGKPLEGEAKKQLLEKGYEAWVNDSYWLIMPYKLKDPGVVLKLAGELSEKGTTWDKLALSFDKVGLTPKDRYWAYVNRTTHLVDRWEYILQDENPKGPPSRFDWNNWQRYGKVMLSPDKMNATDKERIYFPNLAVMEAMPDAVFNSPAPAK
jgi:hypothetical protein